MHVYEALVMEELVDCVCHLVAHTVDCSECVGSWAKMCYSSEELERSVLLLKRVANRVALSVNLDSGCLDLSCLAASHRLYKLTPYGDACSGCHLCKHGLVLRSLVDYNLYIIDSRTVIKCDERHILVASLGPYPSFGKNVHTCLTLEQVLHFGSDYCFH